MATASKTHAHPVRTLIVFAIITVALYGLMAFGKAWTPKLGLDLRGGTSITLTASNKSGTTVDPASLDLARTIIQQRVDSLGVGESEVTTSGTNQILVSVPNVQRDELVRLVGQTAQLYFRIVYAADASAGSATTTTSSTSNSGASQNPAPMPGLPTPVGNARPTTAGATPLTVDQILAWQPSAQDQSDFADFVCGDTFPDVIDQPLIACDKSGTTKLLMGPAVLAGSQLTSAQAGVPQNQLSWIVNLEFNPEGATTFEKVTSALAKNSEPRNMFAIVLDSQVISYPRVSAAIPGGRAEISGSFTQATATQLANVLKYGALPLSFDVSEVNNVSATLGGEQLQAGIIAGIIGLLLVIVYAIAYYRGLAGVVIASLAIAAALTYATMVLLGQSLGFALNLPGIAGAIVAIGITADSFVIYFERIRDEVREGRSLRTAIETGWVRSRQTILIADGVSLLSAVVLFLLAIGAVKGFAFTLGMTTLIDVIIVFFFTKPLVTLLGRTAFFGEGRRFSGFEPDHLGAASTAGAVRTFRRKEA